MAEYKEVTLLDGQVVKVYRPPSQRLISLAEKKFPKPQVPVVSETTKSGKNITMRIDDDPEYLQALERWNEQVNEEVDRMGSLFMFKGLQVPEGWNIEAEIGAEMHYLDPDWKPREGEIGRKLDYIEWVILGDVMNKLHVTEAMRELSGIPLEEVAANEASFPSEVQGEAD